MVPLATFELVTDVQKINTEGPEKTKVIRMAAVFKIGGVCVELDRCALSYNYKTLTIKIESLDCLVLVPDVYYITVFNFVYTESTVSSKSDLGEYIAMMYYSWIILSRRLKLLSARLRTTEAPQPPDPSETMKKRGSLLFGGPCMHTLYMKQYH